MPLYDPNRKKQHKIGKKEHWKLFEDKDFQNSILHRLYLSEIIYILDREEIDSSKVGDKIITKLRKKFPGVTDEYSYEDRGSLFGMTLWNILAQRKDEWYFKKRSKEDPIEYGTIYWRKRD